MGALCASTFRTLKEIPIRDGTPLLLPRRLAVGNERLRLAQALSLLTVSGFEEETFIGELRDERAVNADERRMALIARLKATERAATDGADSHELAQLYAEQNAQLSREVEQLREDLDDSRHKVAALQFALAQAESASTDSPGESAPFAPTDVADAVEQAEALFPDDLLVLSSAKEAAEASPFRDPAAVADALAAIAAVARRAKSGGLGKKMREAFADLNMDYSGGLSPTTPKKLRKQYVFADEEREYVCEEHIRVGGGSYDPADTLRIYINTKDRPRGRVVIGHVGRHLDVISTT